MNRVNELNSTLDTEPASAKKEIIYLLLDQTMSTYSVNDELNLIPPPDRLFFNGALIPTPDRSILDRRNEDDGNNFEKEELNKNPH